MGKARILQALGEGRYTIEIIEARERAEAAKQQAEARIQVLTAEVNALTQQINTAQQAVDQAVTEQNAAIEQWQQEVAEEGSSSVNLTEAAEKAMTAAGKRDALQTEKRSKELRITADQALVARINSLPPLRQMQAWCADYTDDLSGEVATAEVPGEIGSVIIKPGFEGANQWSATTDGAMQPALAGTPAGVFYNLAMQPGWQKWRPTYRVATITSIDGDTCSIALDAATSSQQGLSVNAQSGYSGVPILYMDCNGAAFEQGDKVLVAFAGNINGPVVVGFESGPRECRFDIDTTKNGYLGAGGVVWTLGGVSYAHGLILRAKHAFQINRITFYSYVTLGLTTGVAILRLDSGLSVTGVAYQKWSDETYQFGIDEEIDPAITIESGERIAIAYIRAVHPRTTGLFHYAFRSFRYDDFIKDQERHVEVIMPSPGSALGFTMPKEQIGWDVPSTNYEEIRKRFNDGLVGSQFSSMPSSIPAPMQGIIASAK